MPIVLLLITQCLYGSQLRPTVSTQVINLTVLIEGTVVAPEFIRLEQKGGGKKNHTRFFNHKAELPKTFPQTSPSCLPSPK